MSKIQGGNLMLFINGKSIAYATNHTLEISGETKDTSNKDEGAGAWASEEVGLLSWTASTENLYSEDGEGNLYADLFDAMIDKTPIPAVFSLKSASAEVVNVTTGGWTPIAAPKYTGNVVITSLSLNAPNGEYATFTANFSGVGALTKVESGN